MAMDWKTLIGGATQNGAPLFNEQGNATGYNQWAATDPTMGDVDIVEIDGRKYASWDYKDGTYMQQMLDAAGNPVGEPQRITAGSAGLKDWLGEAAKIGALAGGAYFAPELAGMMGMTGGAVTGGGALAGSPALGLTPEVLPAITSTPAYASLLGGSLAPVAIGAGVGAGGAGLGAASKAGAAGGMLSGGVADALKIAAPIAGAVAGSKPTETTSDIKKTMDPRLDSAVYGQNGLLGRAQQVFNSTPISGQNATMVQGQEMLRGLLSNPAIAQGLLGMTQAGSGMMQRPVAGNPLAGWKPRGY